MRRIFEVVLLIVFGLLIVQVSRINIHEKEDHQLADITVPHLEINMEYGIILDSLIVFEERVKRNEFLADILLKYNVDYNLIDKIARNKHKEFDVRKIRRGNTYKLICSNDDIPRVLYFVYEFSPVTYVVIDFRDTLNIYKGEKDMMVKCNHVSGTITSSLWNAMVDNDTDPNLANELSEIYAWVIDFFGISKGDYYKVYYEELYVDDQYIGLGKVLAALFNHNGYDYWAIYFIQDSIGDYFDENAGSMRRTFLKAPLRYSRISSGYSHSRLHPILKIYRPHHGIDYAAPYGTPVLAIGDGVISKKRYTKQGGREVHIKHNGTYATAYLHLSAYGKGINKGAKVAQGDVIGYVGKSGLATGPHLDFRFYRNGKAVNPLSIESPPAEPVDSINMERFNIMRNELMGKLNSPTGDLSFVDQ